VSGAIFISYRRADSEGEAGRLYDDLIRVLGSGAVFMDVSDIRPGKDFRQAINDNVSKCTVLLAIIGPGWTTVKDASGARRLDQADDFVRLEIAAALARGTDVIPVLAHGARMPTAADLPGDLQDLAYRNCVELTHARWNSDVELFTRTLREYLHRRPPRKLSGGAGTAEKAGAARPFSRFAPLFAVIAAVIALSVGGVFAYRSTGHKKDAPQAPVVPAPSSPATVTVSHSSPAAAKDPASGTATVPLKTSTPTPAPEAVSSGRGLTGWWYLTMPPHLIPDGTPVAFYIAAHGNQFVVEMHAGAGDGGTSTSCGTQSVPLTNNGLSMVWNERASADCRLLKDGYAANVRLDLQGKYLQMTLSGKYPSTTMQFKPDGAGQF
jgi:hypothetical protein